MSKNEYILALNELGQSVWYDNCSRDVLNSGELKSLIEAGVSGLTSNPSIFKAAIADSADYDEEIKKLLDEELTKEEICECLMIQDVQAAADLLAPNYQATDAGDGYASIEVSPMLARDTEATITAARELWKKVDKANAMIKIPATKEGLPAIAQALEEGININATLIFSPDVYSQVAEAYISALETRVAKNQDIKHLSSVASIFVSRVDTICDKALEEAKAPELLGKMGVANSKLCYEIYEQLFYSERFKKLQASGAMLQRPLWASTSTKNPTYPPLLYVEELAGKNTVNTVPPKTLKILMTDATIEARLHDNLEDARDAVRKIMSLEIPYDGLLAQLEVDGVKAFADAYQQMLEATEQKMKMVAS